MGMVGMSGERAEDSWQLTVVRSDGWRLGNLFIGFSGWDFGPEVFLFGFWKRNRVQG